MQRQSLSLLLSILFLSTTSTVFASETNQQARFAQMLEERFTAADANQDGQLSAAEAKAGMPFISRQFNAIDSTQRGAVTLGEIQNYFATKAMTHRGNTQ